MEWTVADEQKLPQNVDGQQLNRNRQRNEDAIGEIGGSTSAFWARCRSA
jgi:hypothetical protein